MSANRSCLALLLVLTSCAAVMGSGSPTTAPALPSIGDPVWDMCARAQVQWQKDLSLLIADKRPDLKSTAEAFRDQQLAMLNRRAMQLRFLLDHHPERLVRNRGWVAYVNYNWTDDDERAMLRDELYVEVIKTEAAANLAVSKAQTAEARAFLQEQLVNDPSYKALQEKLGAEFAKASAFLEKQGK
jgi:hypothetical protein